MNPGTLRGIAGPTGSSKSVQRGSIVLGPSVYTLSVPIVKVNTNKARLNKLGVSCNAGQLAETLVRIRLSSDKTITAERAPVSTSATAIVEWELYEDY